MQIQTHLNKVTATFCDEESLFLISSFGINQYPILRVVAFGGVEHKFGGGLGRNGECDQGTLDYFYPSVFV